jgi:hypothetical protein
MIFLYWICENYRKEEGKEREEKEVRQPILARFKDALSGKEEGM